MPDRDLRYFAGAAQPPAETLDPLDARYRSILAELAAESPAVAAIPMVSDFNDALKTSAFRCYIELPPADVYMILVGGRAVTRCYHQTPHEITS